MKSMGRIVLALLLAALVGCGGGDSEPSPDGRVDPPPLNCAEHPELCK